MSNTSEALAVAKAKLADAKSTLTSLNAERSNLINHNKDLELAIDYLSKLLEFKSKDSVAFLVDLVNDGLRSIFFDQNLSITFESSVKNNKLQYNLVILNGDIKGSNESYGGGVLAVISMILRFAINYQLKLAKLLVFDESLSFVSSRYRDNVSEFLNAIAKRFGYSIVLISHDFGASKVYEVIKHPSGYSNIIER